MTLSNPEQIKDDMIGQLWTGNAMFDPYHAFGEPDPDKNWPGWVYAVDAGTGASKWRLKSNFPIVSGTTPIAVDIMFFSDMGGNLFLPRTRPTAKGCAPRSSVEGLAAA